LQLGSDTKKITTSLGVDGIPSYGSIFAAVELIEPLNVFPTHLEIKHIDIGTHTVRVLRLGKGNETGLRIR
jgi:hypothetical protein